uniref:Uncharacterized protein n=1 Tax=Globodera rostochiensis TaxID=31243 RepID=A0A914HDR9_GLORO
MHFCVLILGIFVLLMAASVAECGCFWSMDSGERAQKICHKCKKKDACSKKKYESKNRFYKCEWDLIWKECNLFKESKLSNRNGEHEKLKQFVCDLSEHEIVIGEALNDQAHWQLFNPRTSLLVIVTPGLFIETQGHRLSGVRNEVVK